jgi:hypothetical protein
MKTISVRVSGDTWLNQDQVEQQLKDIQDHDWVCFDTGAEGISLKHSGILDFIDQWVKTTGYSTDYVVINNPNNYEKTKYKNIYSSTANHFFPMSGHYQTSVPCIDPTVAKFGFFVGRHTPMRNQMVNDVVDHYSEHFILSVMKSRFNANPWTDHARDISSIDDTFVSDQYSGKIDTNLSLLTHYTKFQIELVAETMCCGETFFPTEKTIRPLLAGRPFLLFGPVNFLTNLKKLGFQTYNLCWDESYDQLEGNERWTAIKKNINNIIDYYDIDLAQKIAQHNQEHLKQWHRLTPPKNIPRVINDS